MAQVCDVCGEEKPIVGNFDSCGGYCNTTCLACVEVVRAKAKADKSAKRAATKANDDQTSGAGTKECTACGTVRDLKSFSGNRAKCTPCRNREAIARNVKKEAESGGTLKRCKGGNRLLPVEAFNGKATCPAKLAIGAKSDARPGRKTYHRLLNAERKYYVKSRAQQIVMRPVEYRAHLAKRQREYYAAHSEVILKQQVTRPASQLASCKIGARSRGISWELTDDEALELIRSPCFYSGIYVPDEHTTGIDRMDSAKGYTSDNVVPCNGIVNMMKKALSVRDFVDLCGLVATGGASPDTESMRARYDGCLKRNLHAPLTFEELCGAITENFNSEE